MVYRAHINNGAAVFDEPAKLPEGSAVLVQPVEPAATQPTVTPGELFRDVAGRGKDLPSDGSAQHDHYIYGTPKRCIVSLLICVHLCTSVAKTILRPVRSNARAGLRWVH